MNRENMQDRRHFIEKCGWGTAAASLGTPLPSQAMSRREPLEPITTDMLVVGGGPTGIGAAIGVRIGGEF